MGNKSSKRKRVKVNEDPKDNPMAPPVVYNFNVNQNTATPQDPLPHSVHPYNPNYKKSDNVYVNEAVHTKEKKVILYETDRLGNKAPINEEPPKPLITMKRAEGTVTKPANPSEKFYKICKKCKDEDNSSEDIINAMEKLIKQCGIQSIDINYQNVFDDFTLKYIFKYSRPKILQYIMDQFGNNTSDEGNKEIDLYIIDNMQLKNNILHYLVQGLWGTAEQNAIKVVDIIYCDKYEDILKPHGLLYEYNDYLDTPIDYCRKRKFVNLTKKLETVKYVHIHELLIKKCNIPYDISHCIISFVFVVVQTKDLDDLRDRWDVMVSPGNN